MVTCDSDTLMSGGTCGCPLLTMPIDIDHLAVPSDGTALMVQMWPFGVHGGGHIEGHPGWDFTLTADQPVRMPADGTIYEATPSSSEDPDGVDVAVALSCGLRIYFTPMRADTTVVTAGKVLHRGDVLGSMAIVSGRYFVHFGLATRAASPSSPTTACPGALFDASVLGQLRGFVDQSSYQEKLPRTTQVPCADGTSGSFDFPGEPLLCNARLDEGTRGRLATCLNLGPGRTVW
jgi:hypothetical protein